MRKRKHDPIEAPSAAPAAVSEPEGPAIDVRELDLDDLPSHFRPYRPDVVLQVAEFAEDFNVKVDDGHPLQGRAGQLLVLAPDGSAKIADAEEFGRAHVPVSEAKRDTRGH